MPPEWVMEEMTTGPHGGLISVTVWLQGSLLLPQQSVANQVRVRMFVQPLTLVTVPTRLIVTLVPQQSSNPVGRSNVHGVPQSTVLAGAQVMTGGVVSPTWMVWLQLVRLPQQSVISQ